MSKFKEVLKTGGRVARDKALTAIRAIFLYCMHLKKIVLHWTAFILKKTQFYWNQHFWQKLRETTIQDEPIGASIDKSVAQLKECRDKLRAWLFQYDWVRQLHDASQTSTQLTTLVTSLFSNILALAFPLAVMQVYDRVIPNRTLSTLLFLSLGVILIFLIDIALRTSRSYLNIWADTKYEYTLGKNAFTKLIDAPLYVYEQTDVGTRLKQFAVLEQIKGFYNNQLLIALYDIPFLFIFLAVIAFIGGWLFLVPLITTIVVTYFSYRFIANSENLLETKIAAESKESDFIVNVLSNIHTAKSIGMEELLIRRYERLQKTGMRINLLSSIHAGDLFTIKTIASQLSIILMAAAGSLSVIHGDIAIGGLSACILLVGRVMRPLDRILDAFNRLKMLSIIRKKLDLIFLLPSEKKSNITSLDNFQGEITLKEIGFYFEDFTERWILKNINLTISPRTLVVITGKKQAQKTTLLNILATITKPTAGQYLLDNHDVDQYQEYDLRKQIAYLTRTGKLFRGTMMDNLSAFDDRLIPTARRFVDSLGLNSVVSRLPNGFDTFVGDRAVEALPGGVINLIFIIRALVNKPKIVLFDETNINLDAQSSRKMTELLVHLKEFATVVVLPGNESTIALADVVYEFQNDQLIRVDHAT
ncbi:MAG: hypothetical protein A3C44_05560 [Gammaproteobacteria bacterium RIFCSPHIGHO2_02_FULL_39_13]|nr:MAG: hypothetical protein A3C44_05560 [Gammaproteobacteria bacterium RIFCSPHIGHO2_02_FULL_39_13]OGT50496.1 MAG: hypothetical protein A3E53_06810 [Gammaproteobacteria bacterium RIFCSPHIGHO2_12_FULL_39_24]